MRFLSLAIVFTAGLVLGGAATWFAPTMLAHAPYAGQDERAVASLSADDVEQLREGRGWGLAKPAELNGYPGPLHVIELADDLDLTPGQSAAVQASFDAMRKEAIRLGNELIAAERALDAAFESRTIDEDELSRRLARAERARAALRGTHLSAHLEVTPLLSETQRERYAALRGYGAGGHAHGGH